MKFIIAYKAVLGVFLVTLGFVVYALPEKDLEAFLMALTTGLGGKAEAEITGFTSSQARVMDLGLIHNLAAAVFLFGILNLVESWGLHLRRRWAEWLTIGATSAFIPYEVYEAAREPSLLKACIFFINISVVYYLARHHELFRSRMEMLRTFKVF